MEKKNDSITSRDVDFAQWYTDVCKKAELMNYSSVKGFINYLPYGYAMWEEIQNHLNEKFKEHGAKNVYLPMVIPMSMFNVEKEHVKGFAPEALVATVGGGKDLEDPLVIRPTSEILFSDLYKKIISSYRDLPILLNQWCSVVRWEKTTRPFLRGSEFLWQEGHCLFETEEEAEKNALEMLEVYDSMGRDLLAIPFLKGKKTESEKFAGAVNTYTVESLMHDGKALQSGTTHNLGRGFAEAYGIKYLGRDNKLAAPYQTSWGASTRLLGAIIMVHGDDNGLVLPPYVAPTQVVIVPIRQQEEKVMAACKELEKKLKERKIRVYLDDDKSKTPGWKFAEYEMKGVPLRIEIGPRDLENGNCVLTHRVDHLKETLSIDDIDAKIPSILHDIHEKMYNKALENLQSNLREAHSLEELKSELDKGGFVKFAYSGEEAEEEIIKAYTLGATPRCIVDETIPSGTKCPVSGKEAKLICYFARAY